MPTGYTADLYEGKDVSFEGFIWECSRAFGALILMRDDPKDAPIPAVIEPDVRYYEDSKVKAEARLVELAAMTPEEIMQANRQDRAEVLKSRAESAVKRRLIRERYQAMLAEVAEWEPPTADHTGLKDFMVQQLEESIRFDCGDISWPEMPEVDPAAWFEEEIARADRTIARSNQQIAEEIERARGRTEWVQALRSSLEAAGASDSAKTRRGQ